MMRSVAAVAVTAAALAVLSYKAKELPHEPKDQRFGTRFHRWRHSGEPLDVDEVDGGVFYADIVNDDGSIERKAMVSGHACRKCGYIELAVEFPDESSWGQDNDWYWVHTDRLNSYRNRHRRA